MVVIGYSDSKNAFKVLNSWGRTWGDQGYGWIDYVSFRNLVREAYVTQNIIVIPPKTPTPPVWRPKPTPTQAPPTPDQFTNFDDDFWSILGAAEHDFTAITGQPIPDSHKEFGHTVSDAFVGTHALGGFTDAHLGISKVTALSPDHHIIEKSYVYSVMLVENVKVSVANQIYESALSHIKSILNGSAFQKRGEGASHSVRYAGWTSWAPSSQQLPSKSLHWDGTDIDLERKPSPKGDFQVILRINKGMSTL
jgi:hypothetical protein